MPSENLTSYEQMKNDLKPLAGLMVIAGTICWIVFLIPVVLIFGQWVVDTLMSDPIKYLTKAGYYLVMLAFIIGCVFLGRNR